LLAVAQDLLHRDDVDGLLLIEHLDDRFIDRAVPQIVEHLRTAFEFADELAHAFVGRKKDAAQHTLFGFDGMGRQTVHLGGVCKIRLRPAALLEINRHAARCRCCCVNHARSVAGMRAPAIESSRESLHRLCAGCPPETHQPRAPVTTAVFRKFVSGAICPSRRDTRK